nr:hypothetical protein [Bacillus siamensis]
MSTVRSISKTGKGRCAVNFMFTIAKERLQRDHWEQQQSMNAEVKAEEPEAEEENPTS